MIDGPSKPSSLKVRFLPVSQYLLKPVSGIWIRSKCGVLTSQDKAELMIDWLRGVPDHHLVVSAAGVAILHPTRMGREWVRQLYCV